MVGEIERAIQMERCNMGGCIAVTAAVAVLVNDADRRHAGEDLLCPYMLALEAASTVEIEIDKKVVRQLYGNVPYLADMMVAFVTVIENEFGSKISE
jgi:hypothetical protein